MKKYIVEITFTAIEETTLRLETIADSAMAAVDNITDHFLFITRSCLKKINKVLAYETQNI